jgi:predicted dehydrogenase
MPSSPIRIGLIGAGIYMRDTHAPAYRLLSHQFEVVAIYSRTHEPAARLAATFDSNPFATTDLERLLQREDIEAVDIALPIEHMPRVVEAALRAGKHVISEKPAAPNLAEGQRLAAVAAQFPAQTWMVAENWRYEAAYDIGRSLLADGIIGTPIFVTWTVCTRMDSTNPYYGTEWRRSPQFQGGYLFDVGVHHAAALRGVIGEVAHVSAHMKQMRPDLPPADTLCAAITFENGMLGSYACTFAPNATLPPLLIVLGSDGTLKIDRPQIEIVKGQDVERRPLWDTQPRAIVTLLQDFAAILHGEKPNDKGSVGEALRDIAVMEALFRSAASGKAESVERI